MTEKTKAQIGMPYYDTQRDCWVEVRSRVTHNVVRVQKIHPSTGERYGVTFMQADERLDID